MHHLRRICRPFSRSFSHSWKGSHAYAYGGGQACGNTEASRHGRSSAFGEHRRGRYGSLAMESRGHHRHSSAANFGVRRPLRYLSYQLDLDEAQARKVASILNRLKTEQEQAALDHKRTVAAVADLIAGAEPLEQELTIALAPRKQSEDRMQQEVRSAIQALHAVLDQDQRERLADLMLAGSFTL